jgi:ATPase subunit of ABC transporter with duplicated ATPase domains
VLEALLRGPESVLILDEPDNFLDVPGKLWLEQRWQAIVLTVYWSVLTPRTESCGLCAD